MRVRRRRDVESQQQPWAPEPMSDTYRSNAFRPHTVPAPYMYAPAHFLAAASRRPPKAALSLTPANVRNPRRFESMYTLSSGRKVGRTRMRAAAGVGPAAASTSPAEVDPWKTRVVPGFQFHCGPESRTSSQTGAWHRDAGHTPYVPIRVQKRFGGAVVADADLGHSVKRDMHQTSETRSVQKVFPKLCASDPSLQFVLGSVGDLEQSRERLRIQLRELQSRGP